LVAGVIAAVVVLIVIVVLVTGGSGSKGGAFKGYLGRLAPIAAGSQQVGKSLSTLLAQVRSGRLRDPAGKLDLLTRQAEAELAAATRLNPPAGLQSEHEQALSALDFRVRGLQGLRHGLAQVSSASSAARTGLVSAAVDSLVTGDVLWHDRVWQPTVAALKRVGVAGSVAPLSVFVTDPNLTSAQSIALLVLPAQPHTATTTLSLAATGAAVVAWQTQLNDWLRLKHEKPLPTDGAFGPGTQTATEALQQAQGLTPDGVVGPATRKALQTALAG
jgi:murein L,D-transpeptidase YcbB/YkuD